MKIDRLRVFMSRDKDRPRVVLAMDTDEGVTGWGECYNHGPDLALFPLLEYLLRFIRGQDPRRITHIHQYLMKQTRFPPGALGLAAISAIRVNAINPGGTRTNMRASAYPGENPQSVKTPEELMPLYLYLLGPDSTGISGQSFDAQPVRATS